MPPRREAGQKEQSGGGTNRLCGRCEKFGNGMKGNPISTSELMDVFAEELPTSLRYEGKKSLDWFLEGWINGTALPKLELKG